MDKFLDLFHSKLYDKETLLKWELPEEVKERLGIDEYEFFFLTTAKEDSHEGHKHVHLSIFPTNYEIINLLEVETPSMNPKILQKILEGIKNYGSHARACEASIGSAQVIMISVLSENECTPRTEDYFPRWKMSRCLIYDFLI